MFTTNTVLASVVGLIYLDDRGTRWLRRPAAAGFVLAITAAIAIAHYAAKARQTGALATPGSDRVAT